MYVRPQNRRGAEGGGICVQHRQHRLHGECLFSEVSKHGLIAPRPITAGSTDDTIGVDAIFSPRAHLVYPGPCSAFTRERNFDPQAPEECLRPPQSTREGPGVFCPCAARRDLVAGTLRAQTQEI